MKKKVLITVTTYPLPSGKYQELVCAGGFDENREFIRIYPIPLSSLLRNRFRKYSWGELSLEKRDPKKDFRPNTFSPINKNLSDLKILAQVDTRNNWKERKEYCLNNVYTSMISLIEDAYKRNIYKSLAVFKPNKFISFIIEKDERDWKPKWKEQIKQLCLFTGDEWKKIGIKKVPYKFYYRFLDDMGKESKLMVEDWEISQLYWNCLKASDGNEDIAIKKVKQKCWNDLALQKDLHLFLGTTLQWHKRRSPNPFLIVGLFYPPKIHQKKLF